MAVWLLKFSVTWDFETILGFSVKNLGFMNMESGSTDFNGVDERVC